MDPTAARILDAAFACAERYGLTRTTLADVAREAHLSRQTVYRHFPGRHELFGALVLREESRLFERVQRAIEPHRALRPALEAAFAACLHGLREHPLLDKVMASEPDELLPFLTVEASPVLSLGKRMADEVLRTRARGASARVLDRAAETCARIVISYAISPPTEDIDEVASSLAELVTNGVGRRGAR